MTDKYDNDTIKLAQFTKMNIIDSILGIINTVNSTEGYSAIFDYEKTKEYLIEKINIELIIKNWHKQLEIESGYLRVLLKGNLVDFNYLKNVQEKDYNSLYKEIKDELRDIFILKDQKLPQIIINNSNIIKQIKNNES